MDTLSPILHVVNIILVLVILYIYLQNYRKLKSKYTIGLMLFSSLFLVHTIMGLYFDLSMIMYSTKEAELASMALEAVKTISFSILLWISFE